MTISNNRGSEWRKWDLHVHTASSYDYKYKGENPNEILIQSLKDCKISAVAITDHFVIDKERIESLRSLANDIVFFPGVELRTDKGGSNIHPIIIFNENINLSDLVEAFNVFKREKAKDKDCNEKIRWDYNDIVEFAQKHNGIITIHAGSKTNGIDEQISNVLQIKVAIKEEYAETVSIFEIGKIDDIDEYQTYKFPKIGIRPLIMGSDNHNPLKYPNDRNNSTFTWIKADTTFDGLKQIIREPDRVFIGETPQIFDLINNNRTKYIDTLSVKHIDDYKCSDEWFNNITLEFNPELVAIIGNKGSGKSAIADIIALCCNAKNYDDFSFLNERKFKNKGLAKNFEASVKFKDEKEYKKNLFEESSLDKQPLVKYFPQGYFEDLCNNFEKDESFNEEIENIVFQYVKDIDKLGTSSFKELINAKTDAIEKQIVQLKGKLEIQNKEIIALENKENSNYINDIESKIEQKEAELKALVEPEKVEKPNNEDEKTKLATKNIERLQSSIETINKKIIAETEKISIYNINLSTLEGIKKKIVNQIYSINEFKSNIETSLLQFNIDVNTVIKVESDYSLINNKIKEIENQINESLGIIENETSKLKQEKDKLNLESNALNIPQKKYQKYLLELGEYNKRKLAIEGDKEKPEADTLNAYLKEKKYINEILHNDIIAKRNEQINTAKLIFKQKKEIVDVYQRIKESIDKIIHENKSLLDGYNLDISTSVSLSSNFNDKFLAFINQSKKGTFKGKLDGQKNLNLILADYDKNNVTEDNIEGIIQKLLLNLKSDIKDNCKTFIDDQIDDMIGFYNYLFSLDYLETNYQLMQDKKDLKTLSPGEKGALLLVFYLLLDTDNKPLILDQPEDNLDNNSVAKILVKFIRKAKKKRQIIMVTHNPNLAVVADADQIIKTDIEKGNGNKVVIKSGAIENLEINQCIVDVLEGTYNAFHNRDQKYMNKEQ